MTPTQQLAAAWEARLAQWKPAEAIAAQSPTFTPHDGPQRAFMDAEADIVIFGGSAGGGKTASPLMTPAHKGHLDVPGFGAVIFRRTYPDITAEGGLWDESQDWYRDLGGTARENPLEWRFPSGAKVTFAHMQHSKDRHRWKGAQIPAIYWDQLEEFEASQFWYLLSRNRSLCGVRPYVRATVNPPEDDEHWLYELVGPWVDDRHPLYPQEPGAVLHFTRSAAGDLEWVGADYIDEATGQPAQSLAFIPATIYDNPTLLAGNPEYLTRLRSLLFEDQERLLHGNWRVPKRGTLIAEHHIPIVDAAPADLDVVGRSWDLAGTAPAKGKRPDRTAGALVGMKDGVWYVLDMRLAQLEPDGVDALMDQTAALDGYRVPVLLQQDPGEAGKRAVQAHARRLVGHDVRFRSPTGDKVQRARPLVAAARAGNLRLVRGEWNRALINEAVAFPSGTYDDQVDAVSWAMLMLAFPDAAPPAIGYAAGSRIARGAGSPLVPARTGQSTRRAGGKAGPTRRGQGEAPRFRRTP